MKYRYSGPTSGVTLQQGEETQEVMLHHSSEVDLPEGNEYTKTLVALGHLTPLKTTSKPPSRPGAGADQPAAKGA